MKTTILMTFSADGSSKVETKGVKGKSCMDATKFLETEFGSSAIKLKPDYYQQETELHLKNTL